MAGNAIDFIFIMSTKKPASKTPTEKKPVVEGEAEAEKDKSKSLRHKKRSETFQILVFQTRP